LFKENNSEESKGSINGPGFFNGTAFPTNRGWERKSIIETVLDVLFYSHQSKNN
jgi:hypothetical protein